VFITKRFADCNSINTLFQLLGRAGRVGQSWSAEAYIDNSTAMSLLKYVDDPETSSANLEAINMEKTFINFIKQKQEEENRKIYEQKLLEDKILQEKNNLNKTDVLIQTPSNEESIHNHHIPDIEEEKVKKVNIIPISKVQKKTIHNDRDPLRYTGNAKFDNNRRHNFNNDLNEHKSIKKYEQKDSGVHPSNSVLDNDSDWKRVSYSNRQNLRTNTSEGQPNSKPKGSTYVPPHKRQQK
jgi:hypothetical protein